MTKTGRKLTSSGVFGPPEGGACRAIVPGPHVSSSYNGQDVRDMSGVEDADKRRSGAPPPLLRLRGGGSERGSDKEEERRVNGESGGGDPDFSVPGPSEYRKPGPRSRTRLVAGSELRKGSAERDRRGTDGSGERKKEKSREEDMECEETPSEHGRGSRESSPASSLGAPSRSKRTWEEAEGEAVIISSDDEDMDASPTVVKRKKDGTRQKRGGPTKDPSQAGQFTAEAREVRKRTDEERKQAEVYEWTEDTSTKAKTKRAVAAERNAMTKMREMDGIPTASITQLGMEAVEEIIKVATSSKNLQGPFVGKLWKSAEDLTALNLVLTKRARAANSEEEEKRLSETEELRKEILALRTSEALLQGQVKALREAMAKREAARAATIPTPGAEEKPTRRKAKAGAKNYVVSSSSLGEGNVMEAEKMEVDRSLSPASREAGRVAREEVEQDLMGGTLPPVVRPPIQGRSVSLKEGGLPPARGAEVLPPPPSTRTTPTIRSVQEISPPVIPSLEEIVRAVMGALTAAGVIPSLGTSKLTPAGGSSRGGEAPSQGRGKMDPSGSLGFPLSGAPGDQKEGSNRKKKKKKGKRRKGRGDKTGVEVPLAQPGPSSSKEQAAPLPTEAMPKGGEAHAQPSSSVETWAEVAKKGRKKKTAGTKPGGNQVPPQKGAPSQTKGAGGKGKESISLPRGPRGAAVTITCPEGRYAQIITEARGSIKLGELGISEIRTRRAITGALVLEVPGQEGSAKAEALRRKMVDLFAGREEIKISRPVRRLEIRVRDLDDSVTAKDVGSAVAGSGRCLDEEVLVGPIRKGPNGMNTAWVRCPFVAARKVVAGGRLTVGWTSARVEVLSIRPLQCFKCLKEGHVRAQCPSGVDRSGQCYRCGSKDHKARQCGETAKCPVCTNAGLPSNHRLGGRACKGVKAGAKKKGVGAPPSKPAGKDSGVGTPMEVETTPPQEEEGAAPPQEQRTRRIKETGAGGPAPMEVSPEETGVRNH